MIPLRRPEEKEEVRRVLSVDGRGRTVELNAVGAATVVVPLSRVVSRGDML